LTGAPVPGVAKYVAVSKSPLSGGIVESAEVGTWGAALKRAGLDAVVIVGKAKAPVWLLLANGTGVLKQASDLWGRSTGETTSALEDQVSGAHVLCIGPAGEAQVRYASIVSDRYFANLRGGLGAVMGAKNLKAVVAVESQEVATSDPGEVRRIAADFEEHFLEHPVNGAVHALGMAAFYEPLNQGGFTSSLNGRTTALPTVHSASGSVIHEGYFDGRLPCDGCPGGCPRRVRSKEGSSAHDGYRSPELELLMAIGNGCGILSLDAIRAANERFLDHGIDYVSFGVTLSLAMECFERGLLTPKATGGLDLRFGNAGVLVPLIDAAVKREGFGKALAEGSLRMARGISAKAVPLAMQSKGLELPLHDPRTKPMLGLSYAVSPCGPDDLSVEHDSDYDKNAPDLFLERSATFGILERLDTTDLGPKKVRMMRILEDVFSFMNSAGICKFAASPCRYYTFSQLRSIAAAVTGWEVSLWELMQLGERRIALQKAFNQRAGVLPSADVLPPRMFEPIDGGPQSGVRLDTVQFDQARSLYYSMRGWDERTGELRRAKAVELDIEAALAR